MAALFQSKLDIVKPILDAVIANAELIKSNNNVVIEAYCNGREQGYSLIACGSWKQVAFAQSRNSDFNVLYIGLSGDFNMQGNVPNDAVYRSSMGFAPNDLTGIVDAIINYFNQDV